MEILSQLESKIESLLQKNRALEDENRRLKEEAERGAFDLKADNARLREELERERGSKDEVLGRIDGLLKKLSDDTP
ncbi:cell division protein ZapB [Desulfocurvus sp. DL9XJH121]